MNGIHRRLAAVVVLFALAAACGSPASKRYRIYLSMSYIGNDWQAEAANMIKAMAASEPMRAKLQLETQVAGPDAQKQIQQINAMVQAGAQAIVVFPISPTALNQVVRAACDKGVVVIAYDGAIDEPCAYNVHIDQREAGRVTGEWLANSLGGRGNIVMLTGVPGTSVDTERTEAAKAAFARYPGLHVTAEGVGMWSQAVARTELSKITATHPWAQIDGLWLQVGCFTAAAMEDEAGLGDAQKKPCAGEGANGHRVQMLKHAEGVKGASGVYRPMGYPSISYASPPYSGALALKLAVQKLDGQEIPKLTTLPLPTATNDTIKLCGAGTWTEMAGGCNVFQPAMISNPGWFAAIYSPDTPEVGLQAALSGKPER
jgi:ribose transport system substrate-binding protein